MSDKQIQDWFSDKRDVNIHIVYSHNFIDFNSIDNYKMKSATSERLS